uniref:Protein TSSC4 n=1 Tax=Setaria digitata TaxID=48799 RepID=A0A915PSK8_9BILA
MWILAIRAGPIILQSGSAAAESRNSLAEEKWNEMDDADYNDDENAVNENFQDSDNYPLLNAISKQLSRFGRETKDQLHAANITAQEDRIIEDQGDYNDLIKSDESEDDNEDESEEQSSSTEEAGTVECSHGTSPPTRIKKETIDESFVVFSKTNGKRVKRVSRAGNSRRTKIMQERRGRLDTGNSVEKNQNHHKHRVTDNK